MLTDQVCPSTDAVRSWKKHGLRSLPDEFGNLVVNDQE